MFNILLQVLDDGRLTDNKGRTVNFKNTIIIMTSNAKREMLHRIMRPEFLNRIDEIIDFHKLSEKEIKEVVRIQVNNVVKMLAEQGFTLRVSDAAMDILAHEGYDPDFGARPVKRAIQHLLLNELSRQLLSGAVTTAYPISVDSSDNGLVFTNK